MEGLQHEKYLVFSTVNNCARRQRRLFLERRECFYREVKGDRALAIQSSKEIVTLKGSWWSVVFVSVETEGHIGHDPANIMLF